MQILKLSLLAVLVQLATFCWAIPLDLTPRGRVCSNAPNTVAGTLLERGTGQPTNFDSIWCLPRTSIWVAISYGSNMAGTYATELLIDGYNRIGTTIKDKGDGPILKGLFEMTSFGLTLAAKNANNHQLTRGVLEAALTALWQAMRQHQYQHGTQGLITFMIFDGGNQVGTGSIQQWMPPI